MYNSCSVTPQCSSIERLSLVSLFFSCQYLRFVRLLITWETTSRKRRTLVMFWSNTVKQRRNIDQPVPKWRVFWTELTAVLHANNGELCVKIKAFENEYFICLFMTIGSRHWVKTVWLVRNNGQPVLSFCHSYFMTRVFKKACGVVFLLFCF